MSETRKRPANETLIRWARSQAERTVTANGARASFISDMFFDLADALEEASPTQPSDGQSALDARRYRYLRERDLDTIDKGGVFAGMTPENVVLNGDDLDRAVDAALLEAQEPGKAG